MEPPPKDRPPIARLLVLEDRYAVFAKPPGLSLQTSRAAPAAAAERLVAALPPDEREQLAERELHLVHRLDAPTSGLVLVALDADEHRRLARAFAERRVEKTYLALVWGRPRPARALMEQSLGPDRKDRRRMRVDPDGRPAITDRWVVASAPHVSLVALWPRTGRTHQLRVHLAAAGHPIVGDDLYGGPRHHGVRDRALRDRLGAARAQLHAWRLVLPAEYRNGSERRYECPPPEDFTSIALASGLATAPAEDLWRPPEVRAS